MPDDTPALIPVVEPPVKRERLSESQRSAIALMAVQGRPTSAIASATRRTPASIRRLVKEDPDIRARMTEYENRIVTVEALHRFKMLEYASLAEAAIVDGLGAPDLKLRVATAWEWVKQYTPKPAEQVDVNHNIEGQIEVGKHLKVIVGSIEKLAEANVSNGSFQSRIRDELPGPTTLEPLDVEVKVEE